MSTYKKIILFALLLVSPLLFGHFVFGQTEQEKVEQLREQIEQLEEQKKVLQNTIAKTAAEADTLKNQIANLKNQISSLQVQIQLTGKKINQTSGEITGVQENIYDTQERMDDQRQTIGQLLLYLHKRDNENLVGMLLKSTNLSDYFNQEQYALTINQKLLDLVNDLKQAESKLKEHKGSLEFKKQSLESLRRDQNIQKASLANVQTEKDQLLKATKGQEAAYQRMLAQVEEQQNVFFTQLRELETHIIQGGLYIVHVTAASLPKKGTKLFQWSEETTRITQGYGCTKYARCGSKRGAYGGAPHNGLDIASGYGSLIYTIAEGEIIANGRNDGWGNWVAIKHPNQYNLVSLYAHLSSLSFLQVGSQVPAGQVIGYEGKTGHVTGSHLHLSIYKDFFTYVSDKNDQLYFNYFEGSVNPLDYL